MARVCPYRASSTSESPSRRALIGALAGGVALSSLPRVAFGASTYAAPVVAPGVDLLVSLDTGRDMTGRVIAPVFVNERGPFRFIVDTGANRSVLSTALAAKIGAVPDGVADVHGVTGVRTAPMARVASLRTGALSLRGVSLPVLDTDMLGSADGMLGVQGMESMRLEIDNRRRTLVVTPSSAKPPPADFSVRAQFRFGNLACAQGKLGPLSLPVIFDTGADVALANPALRDWVAAKRGARAPLAGSRLSSAASAEIIQSGIAIRAIALEGCKVERIAAAVGDFHIFRIWNLSDQPALVLGMQVLESLAAFSIDYGRRLILLKR
jgi:Aspartyl protease